MVFAPNRGVATKNSVVAERDQVNELKVYELSSENFLLFVRIVPADIIGGLFRTCSVLCDSRWHWDATANRDPTDVS